MARAQQKNNGALKSDAAAATYEGELWKTAAALRGSMGATEYKRVVLGLIVLKHISDVFEGQHAKLVAEEAAGIDSAHAYRAQCVGRAPSRRQALAIRRPANGNAHFACVQHIDPDHGRWSL